MVVGSTSKAVFESKVRVHVLTRFYVNPERTREGVSRNNNYPNSHFFRQNSRGCIWDKNNISGIPHNREYSKGAASKTFTTHTGPPGLSPNNPSPSCFKHCLPPSNACQPFPSLLL